MYTGGTRTALTSTPTAAPISVSSTRVRATPGVPPRVVTSRALTAISMRWGPSLRTWPTASDTKMTSPTLHQWRPSRSATASASSTPAVTLATRWRLPVIVLTRVSWVTSRAVRGASTGGCDPGRRRASSQEMTAARVVLAVRSPSGEPSSRRLASRRRSIRLPSRRPDRRSRRRSDPVRSLPTGLPAEGGVDDGGVGQVERLQVAAVVEVPSLDGGGVEAQPRHGDRGGRAGELVLAQQPDHRRAAAGAELALLDGAHDAHDPEAGVVLGQALAPGLLDVPGHGDRAAGRGGHRGDLAGRAELGLGGLAELVGHGRRPGAGRGRRR